MDIKKQGIGLLRFIAETWSLWLATQEKCRPRSTTGSSILRWRMTMKSRATTARSQRTSSRMLTPTSIQSCKASGALMATIQKSWAPTMMTPSQRDLLQKVQERFQKLLGLTQICWRLKSLSQDKKTSCLLPNLKQTVFKRCITGKLQVIQTANLESMGIFQKTTNQDLQAYPTGTNIWEWRLLQKEVLNKVKWVKVSLAGTTITKIRKEISQ